jgi:hypothetical protein
MPKDAETKEKASPPPDSGGQHTLRKSEQEWLHNWFTAITEAQASQLATLKSINRAVSVLATLSILALIAGGCSVLFSL